MTPTTGTKPAPAPVKVAAKVPVAPAEAAAQPAAGVQPAAVQSAAVRFSVGGQTFQIAAKLVRAKPDTVLAKVLARSDAGISLNVPVDVCPDRFRLILDWYRYGEIWVPATLATEAVLKDAARRGLRLQVRSREHAFEHGIPTQGSSCQRRLS